MNIEQFIEKLFSGKESTIARDLKLNLNKLLTQSSLDDKERSTLLLALSQTLNFEVGKEFAKEWLTSLDFTQEQILEAQESAAIMGMLNVYYRTQHMLGGDDYKQAGLRMTSLARPLLGKAHFELLAFAISTINGCSMCVSSHEKALRHEGVTPEKIHDSFRLAAVLKGASTL